LYPCNYGLQNLIYLNQFSPAQYEEYFKKRGQPKNLKKEEWRAVHAKLSDLSSMGIETRVKISGQIQSKA